MEQANIYQLIEKADGLIELEKFDAAIAILQQAYNREERRDLVYQNLIICFLAIPDHNKAKKIVDVALEEYPQDAFLLALSGEYYHDIEDNKTAITCLKEAVAIQPQNYTFINLLGSVYTSQGNYKEAEKTLKHAEELNPNHVGTISELIRLYSAWAKEEESKQYLKKGLELDPENAYLLSMYTMLVFEKYGSKKAEEVAYETLAKNPDDELSRKVLLEIFKKKYFLVSFFTKNAFARFVFQKIDAWTVIAFIFFFKGMLIFWFLYLMYILVTWYGGVLFNSAVRLHKRYKYLLGQDDVKQSNLFLYAHLLFGAFALAVYLFGLDKSVFYVGLVVSLFYLLTALSYFEIKTKLGKKQFWVFGVLASLVVFWQWGVLGPTCVAVVILMVLYGFCFSLRILFR